MDKKASSLISLCLRAGHLKYGETQCEKALRDGDARLVILSDDASANTKKKFVNKAYHYKVPVLFYGDKYELGKLTGAGVTSSVCVTDLSLSNLVRDAVQAATPGR